MTTGSPFPVTHFADCPKIAQEFISFKERDDMRIEGRNRNRVHEFIQRYGGGEFVLENGIDLSVKSGQDSGLPAATWCLHLFG